MREHFLGDGDTHSPFMREGRERGEGLGLGEDRLDVEAGVTHASVGHLSWVQADAEATGTHTRLGLASEPGARE